MRANEIEAVAATLEMEAGTIRRDLTGLEGAELERARAAFIEPREKAATALREAANAMRAIPAIGIGRTPPQED